MSRSLIGTILATALGVLFLLLKDQKRKQAARRAAQQESNGYVPITMDDAEPDIVTKSATAASWAVPGLFLALMVFVITAVVFVAEMPPLVKWILAGTLALMTVIVASWSLKRRKH
jgi:hypothetical protein